MEFWTVQIRSEAEIIAITTDVSDAKAVAETDNGRPILDWQEGSDGRWFSRKTSYEVRKFDVKSSGGR